MGAQVKKSILRQISLYMVVMIVLIALGALMLYVVEDRIRSNYERELILIDQKMDLAIDIQQTMSGAVIELRGLMAFRQEEFVEKIKVREQAVNDDIDAFAKLELDAEGREYLQRLRVSRDRYFLDMVPVGIELGLQGDTEEMVRLSREENWTEFVDQFRVENITYIDVLDRHADEAHEELTRDLKRASVSFTVYLVLVALIVGVLAIRLAKDIGLPLQELARVAKQHDADLLLRLPYDRRTDEIGNLTVSLKTMWQQIRRNEREMIEQNEELQAQQEELISQQDELTETVAKMRQHEQVLEAQNRLNASLINTSSRDDLLKSIIQNLVTIQGVDKGAVVLLEAGYPHAAVGLTEAQTVAFFTNLDEGVLARLREERDTLVIERDAAGAEKGYHDLPIRLSDLFVPIFSQEEDVIALLVMTRLGRAFSKEDRAQARALANQVALAIEKWRAYEVSERERVVNQEILDSIREGVHLFDEQGELRQVNHTWRTWMADESNPTAADRRTKECVYRELRERALQADELIAFIEGAMRGERADGETRIYRLSGAEEKVMQVYFERIFDQNGVLRGTVFVHRDMTREYEVDQMKSEFVSTVSHELRTPLSSVLGFTELMLHKELKPERQRKYLETIHKEAERLTQLINDFLDIQRMEAGRQSYDFAKVDLVPLAKELVETMALHAPQHRLELDAVIDPAPVRGDEAKLRQVLLNLIGNAMKYSPNGGEVRVTIREAGEELAVSVADQGLGIPKESLGHLFTKFYRVDNSDRRKIGGTGLGLAICKEIVKAHDGRIEVESQLGEGSVFTLYFPRNQAVRGNEVRLSDGNGQEMPRLMIVEDDDSLALLLQEELQESGFAAEHVREGESALQRITEQLPDAIVLDIRLADTLSGWDVLERLKADERTASIPIFISSALEERERGMSLGANDYLIKPYQPAKLSNLILQTLLRKEKTGVIMVPTAKEGGEADERPPGEA